MKPKKIEVIGAELAVAWDDGSESYIPLEKLRRACPCAHCAGETDVMGNVAKGPETTFTRASFELRSYEHVGAYAIRPVWGDGHGSGLYSFDLLRQLGSS